MVSESQQRSSLDPGDWVWRYMDLWKLVYLLDKQALHFACADGLDDEWEGAVSASTIHGRPFRAAIEAAAISEALGQEFKAEWTQGIYEFTAERMPRHMMVSCWHIADGESVAMWGLYCRDRDGLAIRTTAGKLIGALPDLVVDTAITVRRVKYVDYGSVAIPERVTFEPFEYKRKSFNHEQELRAMFMTRDPEPTGVDVPIDPGSLIEAIYVSPRAPDFHRDQVQSLLTQYGITTTVHRSALDDPALR